MKKNMLLVVLGISFVWWLFPDFLPGPIDDFIAFGVSIFTGISLLAAKAKAAKDALALLAPDSTTPNS